MRLQPVPTPQQILTDQLSAATERPPLRGHRQHELLTDILDAVHHHLRYRADGLGQVAVPTETTERLGVRPPSGYCQDTQLDRLLGEMLRSKRLGSPHASFRQANGLCSAFGITDEAPLMEAIHRAKVQARSVGAAGQRLSDALRVALDIDSVRGVEEDASSPRIEREQGANKGGIDLDGLSAWRRQGHEDDRHGSAPLARG
jgi:hypothetical protein